MQITMQHTHSAWPAKTILRMTLDCSRIGNRDDEWTFCQRQESDIALFLQETRKRKIRKLADYCLKQGDHKQWTLKHRNKQSGWNASMTSKHAFPIKRSTKMIDSTEKTKIPLKFGKRVARYNEFGYKPTRTLYNLASLFNNTWILNFKSKLIYIVFFADAIIITITSNEQQNHKMYKNSSITNLRPWPFELVEVNLCFLRFC